MNEDQMHKLMMVSCLVFTVLAGLGTVGLLVACAVEFSFAMLVSAILLAGITVGAGWATSFYGEKVTGHPLVFTNDAEREVLNRKQRQVIREARAEVVLQRALDEVDKERENITFRQLQAANDPEKPPHQTQWSPDGQQADIRELRERRDRDR